ncbi:DsbA family protein [Aliikangiella sp. G2MR2-5]|uniref:DsbA family protein n=1 Tax=Aliikangiella sp. G2MR2-5 TaxID=2788943 RepID=UPI0018A9AD25|nr:DsbA family protein [Aliikangiella sp. G2MR2-5]
MESCDQQNGCAIPSINSSTDGFRIDGLETDATQPRKINVIFVTDPICSHCWAIEPVWRRLTLNYEINVRYIHGGLLPGWKNFGDPGNGISKPEDVIPHWQQVAAHYGQPIDPSVWINDPIDNSYVLCQAAITVRQLRPELESVFVRLMREQIFLFGKNPSKIELLTRLVSDLGLNTELFFETLDSQNLKHTFSLEQAEMVRLGAKGFPSLLFLGDSISSLSGSRSYLQLEAAIASMGSRKPARKNLSNIEKLAAFNSWTSQEASEVFQLSISEVESFLATQGLEPVKVNGGVNSGNTVWFEHNKSVKT